MRPLLTKDNIMSFMTHKPEDKFGKIVAQSVIEATAETAAAALILLTVGYTYSVIQERKAKKALIAA